MRTLRLSEYGTSRGVRLSPPERDALLRTVPEITLTPVPGERDVYDVTPSSWVGIAALPGLTVQIDPKLSIERLLFLLGYGIGRRRWRWTSAEVQAHEGLLEAFVPLFCAAVRDAIAPGLLQGYRTEEAALVRVRGRIRVEEQIRMRYGVAPPIEVRYDEYTVDTPMNRVLKAAIERLGMLPIRTPAVRSQLRHLAGAFRLVASETFHRARLPTFRYDRLSERYRPAVELALLVLRATSVELRAGRVAAPALLVDMNQVFEDFVVAALREKLGLDRRRFPQNCDGRRLQLDALGRVVLRPDLSWWQGGRCVFVGDVKYKRLAPAGFAHADLYQVLAYCTAADLPGGLLIYAAGEGEAGAYEILHAGKRIDVVHLHLDGPPEAILSEVGDLARRVERWRELACAKAA